MSETLINLVADYTRLLAEHHGSANRKSMDKARDLGRAAFAGGVPLAEIVRAHHQAGLPATDKSGIGPAELLSEFLSSYETAARTARETSHRLRNSIDELENAQRELRLRLDQLNLTHRHVEADCRKYIDLFEHAPSCYVVTDSDGLISEVNCAASQALGMSGATLTGRSLIEFVAPAAQAEFKTQLNRLRNHEIDRKTNWNVSLALPGKNKMPVSLSVTGDDDSLRWHIHELSGQAPARTTPVSAPPDISASTDHADTRRLALLSESGGVLASPPGDATRLAKISRLPVPGFAEWCLIWLAEPDGSLTQLEIAWAESDYSHVAPQIRSRVFAPVEGTADQPFWRSVSPGIFHLPADGWQGPPVGNLEFLDLAAITGLVSMVLVPVAVEDRRFGGMAWISSKKDRIYNEADLSLAQDLARRCALAIENDRLHNDVIREQGSALNASRVKEEFLAVLSHEMRNPLMPVIGWTRVLGNHAIIRNDPMLLEGVRAIERNARTLNRLVGDCLDLTRISEGKARMERSVVDLNAILLATAECIRERAESRQLALALEICGGPLWILGDTARVEQAVVSLLDNAVTFSSPGGAISLHSSLQGNEAEIAVKDNGAGIEQKVLEQIFQPFQRGGNFSLAASCGLGLGLAIARQIAELHDGRIWAESDGPGTGSTFYVRIPLAGAPQATVPAGTDQQLRSESAAIRVLIVEDAADVLYLLKVELEQLGFSILEACDGKVALEVANRERPSLILSDIKMPVMDGYELIRAIRSSEDLRGTPAIALTGFGRKDDIEKALNSGFDACLTKPAEPAELATYIRKYTQIYASGNSNGNNSRDGVA